MKCIVQLTLSTSNIFFVPYNILSLNANWVKIWITGLQARIILKIMVRVARRISTKLQS